MTLLQETVFPLVLFYKNAPSLHLIRDLFPILYYDVIGSTGLHKFANEI